MNNISELETALLNKELKTIREGLVKVDTDLKGIFEKYGVVKGQHKDEFIEFLLSRLISADVSYYSGYTTKMGIGTRVSKIPDVLKEVILKWAVNDFMEKVDEVSEINSMRQGWDDDCLNQ